MYRDFRIQNFRGIEQTEFNDLRVVNLISGRNDVGKSTVLEAFFLHASGLLAPTSAINVLRGARGIGQVGFGSEVGGPWDFLFRQEALDQPLTVEANVGGAVHTLRMYRNPGPELEQEGLASPSGSSGALYTRTVRAEFSRNSQKPAVARHTMTITSGPGTLGMNLNASISVDPPNPKSFAQGFFFSPRSRPTAIFLANQYSEVRRKLSQKNLISALAAVDDRISGVEVLTSEGTPMLWAELKDETLLPFFSLGDGLASVAGYMLAVATVKDSNPLLLIDEIENGIHYGALRQVWRSLYDQAVQAKVQIVATTHSRECLIAAFDELGQSDDALKLYRMTRGQTSSGDVRVIPYNQERLAAGLDQEVELR